MNRSREYNGPLPQRARAIGRLSGYDYINTGRRSSNNKYRTEIRRRNGPRTVTLSRVTNVSGTLYADGGLELWAKQIDRRTGI